MGTHSRVCIGMPVFNGEKYLNEALDSILAQTYRDFELIISDNASNDKTQKICLECAERDHRIRYHRNEKNLGARLNFNRVFELSSAEYFKWAAYDDVLAPEYLQKCVRALDENPSIILCHSKTGVIDEHGTLVGNYDHNMKLDLLSPHERFGSLIDIGNRAWPDIFGVIRSDLLRKTQLIRDFVGSDRHLMAEIGLMGRIHEIPEYLFFRRDHPDAYTRKYCSETADFGISAKSYQRQASWWTNTEPRAISFPNWQNCLQYFKTVRRVPLKWSERILCYSQIYKWLLREGLMAIGSDVENAFFSHSSFGRELASSVKWLLRRTRKTRIARTIIPTIKKE